MVNERLLVEQIKRGDRNAFSALVKHYQRLVFHVVQRLVPNPEDVEDISQEVFIKVYKRLDTFGFEAKLATWIARIAYLTAVDHLRKFPPNKMPTQAALDQLYITDETPEQVLIRSDVSQYELATFDWRLFLGRFGDKLQFDHD